MDPQERRKKGAHYTTEKNIMKLIGPLFLDELLAEFKHLKNLRVGRAGRLEAFRRRLGTLTFLDPACGCGNFLIIAYRELRQLELECLTELKKGNIGGMDWLGAQSLADVDVSQFYGIELEEFPARIAEVAMWMIDHIMNIRLGELFGEVYSRIPLDKSPHIWNKNALRVDWNDLLPAHQCSYVLGNPPFIGHQQRKKSQQSDMHLVWGRKGQVNRLDYVTCWYKKAIDYSENRSIKEIAFVATNSVSQGEQASILWPWIFSQGWNIRFAHRSFQWNSEARGTAAVHCVIVGISGQQNEKCRVFDYQHIRGEPSEASVRRINGYLMDGPQYALPSRGKPLVGRVIMHKGSQPTDGARIKNPEGGFTTRSNLILDNEERQRVLALEPNLDLHLRPFVGGDELISGDWRWCFWLKEVSPIEYQNSNEIKSRLERIKEGRLLSPTRSVQEFSKYPTLFTQDRQPNAPYLAIPEVSSENREYIPMATLPAAVIASNKLQILVDAPILYFALLTSAMHMGWMRTVTGRLESRYSYSPTVYNTFPWPELNPKKEAKISELAQAVLDARDEFPDSTLADLYDPDLMPPVLRKAHTALDKAVDKLYRAKPFESERERVEHLFMLYEKMVAPVEAAAKAKPKKSRKTVKE